MTSDFKQKLVNAIERKQLPLVEKLLAEYKGYIPLKLDLKALKELGLDEEHIKYYEETLGIKLVK